MGIRICLDPPPTRLNQDVHRLADLPSCVPPSVQTQSRWCRNINLLPITYAFRPRLRGRLTRGRIILAQETLDLRREGFSPSLSLLMPALALVVPTSAPFGTPCIYLRMLRYHSAEAESEVSAPSLAPLHFRRRFTRPVSCYALFKWWLLLSQHPGCFSAPTSFPT